MTPTGARKRDRCRRQACPRKQKWGSAFGFGARADKVLSGGNRSLDLHLLAAPRGVLDHYDRVRTRRQGSASHDLGCLARADRDAGIGSTSANLSDKPEGGGNCRDVGGENGVTIARGSRERREVTVSDNGLRS